MAKRGRPLTFTPEIGAEICAHIASGKTLQSWCDIPGNPATRTVTQWSSSEPPNGVPASFAADFARARLDGEEAIAAECLKIADTPQIGEERTMKADGGVEIRRGDMLGHRKLQIETRLKLLAKWNPRKWGDKIEVDANHKGGIAVTIAAGKRDEDI